jgi:hypothetical protein
LWKHGADFLVIAWCLCMTVTTGYYFANLTAATTAGLQVPLAVFKYLCSKPLYELSGYNAEQRAVIRQFWPIYESGKGF